MSEKNSKSAKSQFYFDIFGLSLLIVGVILIVIAHTRKEDEHPNSNPSKDIGFWGVILAAIGFLIVGLANGGPWFFLFPLRIFQT